MGSKLHYRDPTNFPPSECLCDEYYNSFIFVRTLPTLMMAFPVNTINFVKICMEVI